MNCIGVWMAWFVLQYAVFVWLWVCVCVSGSASGSVIVNITMCVTMCLNAHKCRLTWTWIESKLMDFHTLKCLHKWPLYIAYMTCGTIHGWFDIRNRIYDVDLRSWHFKSVGFIWLWFVWLLKVLFWVGYEQAISRSLHAMNYAPLYQNMKGEEIIKF